MTQRLTTDVRLYHAYMYVRPESTARCQSACLLYRRYSYKSTCPHAAPATCISPPALCIHKLYYIIYADKLYLRGTLSPNYPGVRRMGRL